MDNTLLITGDDWQELADKLLLRHYGPSEYQKVPDKDKGDAGIEGFTISEGIAYQAYGPEEPITTQERYEKHRDKITRDIKKFIDNRLLLSRLLGSVKINRWILLVPRFDTKNLIEHANKKTDEVIKANLPYVGPGFHVCIQDKDAFTVELDELIKAGVRSIQIISKEIEQQAIDEWGDANNNLVRTIDDKVSRISKLKTDPQRLNFRTDIIKAYLEGQNVLEELRNYPHPYENITRIKSQKERYLRLNLQSSPGTNMEIFRASLEDIRKTVTEEVAGVDQSTIDAIAYGTVADWLIRCPLDFQCEDF